MSFMILDSWRQLDVLRKKKRYSNMLPLNWLNILYRLGTATDVLKYYIFCPNRSEILVYLIYYIRHPNISKILNSPSQHI